VLYEQLCPERQLHNSVRFLYTTTGFSENKEKVFEAVVEMILHFNLFRLSEILVRRSWNQC